MKTTSKRRSNPGQRLLEFFLENPTGKFYESEAREKAGVSLGAANKHLKELASRGILLLERKGRMNFLQLNRENQLVKQLKIARSLSLPFINELREAGKRLGIKIYIYGSVARGEDVEDSDVDVLLIGNANRAAIEKIISEIRKKTGKIIKISLYTRREWAGMKRGDPAFYESVERDRKEIA